MIAVNAKYRFAHLQSAEPGDPAEPVNEFTIVGIADGSDPNVPIGYIGTYETGLEDKSPMWTRPEDFLAKFEPA